MKLNDLKIYPMGGVGEIGSNMTIFETKNHVVIVDYGILFPYENFFDINYLIVDLQQVPKDKELTLFVTHGHEDHIGAIHHLLFEFPDIKILAPKFAGELLRLKLDRKKLSRNIQVYDNEKDVFHFDEYELHPVHVTHSIPDTNGLIFKAKNQDISVLFISDFKYDEKPLFERPFDVEKIQKVMQGSKTKLAMLDSTNILKPGKTLSESDLTHDLEELISKPGRLFITQFASNVYRLKNILEIAKKHNRKITSIGRSISFYLEAAQNSGLLNIEDYPYVDFDSIQKYNDPKLLYIVTGSQGEFLGATKRIASGEQKHINLEKTDRFVFSSKPIPGNEKHIYRLYNSLAEKEVEIINFSHKQIHASGHPGQEDLKQLVNQLDLTDIVPIHGETYFLRKHIDFIEENFKNINPIYMENYQGLFIQKSEIKHFELAKIDPHLIHGNDVLIEREKISERRKLACNGVIFISLNHKNQNSHITLQGLPKEIEELTPRLKDFVEFLAFEELKKRDHDYTVEQIRIKARKFFQEQLGYRPIVIVHLL